jgi:hypothetical protein
LFGKLNGWRPGMTDVFFLVLFFHSYFHLQ